MVCNNQAVISVSIVAVSFGFHSLFRFVVGMRLSGSFFSVFLEFSSTYNVTLANRFTLPSLCLNTMYGVV